MLLNKVVGDDTAVLAPFARKIGAIVAQFIELRQLFC
jgi:hypothetical protein